MTHAELKKQFPNAGESFLRKNASDSGLGGLPAAERKPRQVEALDSKARREKSGDESLVGDRFPIQRIALVAHRHRLLDSANLVASFKGIQDEIAESFGVSDADSRIQWEYSQIRTRGREGVMVKIEQKLKL